LLSLSSLNLDIICLLGLPLSLLALFFVASAERRCPSIAVLLRRALAAVGVARVVAFAVLGHGSRSSLAARNPSLFAASYQRDTSLRR
jgi:hypothetical protein